MEENIGNYKEISVREFLNKLQNIKESGIIEGIKVSSGFKIPYKYVYNKGITFRFCEFEGIITIIGQKDTFYENENQYLNIESCFFGMLEIVYVGLKDFKIIGSGFGKHINVSKSKIKNLQILSGNAMECNILSSDIENFETYKGNIDTLFFYSSTFNNISIKGGLFSEFSIKKSTVKINFNIQGGIFSTFEIYESVYEGKFEIGDSKFGESQSYQPTFKSKVYFESTIFKTLLLNKGCNINILEISSSVSIKDDCTFLEGNYSQIRFWGGIIGELNFIFSKKLFIGEIKFSYVTNTKHIYLEKSEGSLNRLTFENADIIAGTLIKISDIPINNIIFDNSVNAGNIIFSGVKGKKLEGNSPTLKIHNSDLGKTTFIGCDFEDMKLDFKSSKITEVFLAGTKMPKEITTTDNDVNIVNEQKRLGYGQLKKIYDNRGDTVTANEYFAKEMNVFLNQEGIGVGEKINVGLNWLSSNHGTSWLQALGTTFLVAIFFFWLYGMSIGIYPTTELNSKTEENFYHYTSYLLEFINPLHKADYIPQDFYNNEKFKISGWARLIDGISRVFITYFAYQLIQAFRKHRRGS